MGINSALGYGLYDADNHYYETRDSFTRFIDPKFRDRTIRVMNNEDGAEIVMADDRRFVFLEHRNFATAVKPGALRQMLQAMKSGEGGADVRGTDVVEAMRDEWIGRDARLLRMDEQGVEASLMFPTMGVCVETDLMHDRDLLYASFRSFNRWVDDQWGFAHADRIFAAPIMILADPDEAATDLAWALDQGARIIAIKAGPAYGRSPADPVFDRFWAMANEANIAIGFHIGEAGYNETMSVHWGEEPKPPSHHQSALQWTCFYGDRPIMETIAALIYHNLFGRFPNLKIVSVENGSLWVDYLLAAMNKMNRMGRNGPWPGGPITEKPSDIFKRHVFVSPYHEEPVEKLCETIGVSQVLFGSDYPHPEGLAEPVDFAAALPNLDASDVQRVMRDNLRTLLGG